MGQVGVIGIRKIGRCRKHGKWFTLGVVGTTEINSGRGHDLSHLLLHINALTLFLCIVFFHWDSHYFVVLQSHKHFG